MINYNAKNFISRYPFSSRTENSIAQLREIFPKLSENRIRDRFFASGRNIERATQVLLAEEDERVNRFMRNDEQVCCLNLWTDFINFHKWMFQVFFLIFLANSNK